VVGELLLVEDGKISGLHTPKRTKKLHFVLIL